MPSNFDFNEEQLNNPDNSELKRQKELEAERFKNDTEHRKELVLWIKSLIPTYLLFVFVLIFLSSVEFICFSVSDSVLISILCTTTANVIGLAAIVLRGLFK